MNTFMNFVKRSLAGGGTRGGVEALGRVRASSLLTSDFFGAPASSSYSPGILVGGLTQGLHRVGRDPGAIAKDGGLNVILPNGLADSLGMELLEL